VRLFFGSSGHSLIVSGYLLVFQMRELLDRNKARTPASLLGMRKKPFSENGKDTRT